MNRNARAFMLLMLILLLGAFAHSLDAWVNIGPWSSLYSVPAGETTVVYNGGANYGDLEERGVPLRFPWAPNAPTVSEVRILGPSERAPAYLTSKGLVDLQELPSLEELSLSFALCRFSVEDWECFITAFPEITLSLRIAERPEDEELLLAMLESAPSIGEMEITEPNLKVGFFEVLAEKKKLRHLKLSTLCLVRNGDQKLRSLAKLKIAETFALDYWLLGSLIRAPASSPFQTELFAELGSSLGYQSLVIREWDTRRYENFEQEADCLAKLIQAPELLHLQLSAFHARSAEPLVAAALASESIRSLTLDDVSIKELSLGKPEAPAFSQLTSLTCRNTFFSREWVQEALPSFKQLQALRLDADLAAWLGEDEDFQLDNDLRSLAITYQDFSPFPFEEEANVREADARLDAFVTACIAGGAIEELEVADEYRLSVAVMRSLLKTKGLKAIDLALDGALLELTPLLRDQAQLAQIGLRVASITHLQKLLQTVSAAPIQKIRLIMSAGVPVADAFALCIDAGIAEVIVVGDLESEESLWSRIRPQQDGEQKLPEVIASMLDHPEVQLLRIAAALKDSGDYRALVSESDQGCPHVQYSFYDRGRTPARRLLPASCYANDDQASSDSDDSDAQDE